MKQYLNKDWLIDQYINQKKSTTKIAKEINVGQSTISKWLNKYNIVTRPFNGWHWLGESGNKSIHWKGGKPYINSIGYLTELREVHLTWLVDDSNGYRRYPLLP